MDRLDTSEAEAIFTIDHDCRHGGPDIERNPALFASMQASMGAIAALPPQGAALEIKLFCAFARATPPHPQLHRILFSCAVDALADKNWGYCRVLCRFAVLCSGVARRPALLAELEAGLVALGSGAGAGGGQHVAALAEEVAAQASHTGLLAALRRHMTCGCLAPRSASALPLAEALEDEEGAQGGEGGGAAGGGGGGGGGDAPGAPGAPAPPAEAAPVDVEALSIKQLKAALAERGIPTAGLLEKGDLQAALRAALG